MKKYISLIICVAIATLGYGNSIVGFDFHKDAYEQVIKFIETNEKLAKEGRNDELNYVYVYRPGEEFDFNRAIPSYLLSTFLLRVR